MTHRPSGTSLARSFSIDHPPSRLAPAAKFTAWLTTWLIGLALVAGCGKLSKEQSKFELLRIQAQNYVTVLRWGEFRDLLAYHKDANGIAPQSKQDINHAYRVRRVVLQEMILNEEETEATVSLEVEYEQLDSGLLKKKQFEHSWWYQEEQKQWFNKAELPKL